MSRALDGTNPVAYLGVRPLTPPNMIIPGLRPTSAPRDPTENDYQYNLGDHWLNTSTQGMWYLAALGSHLVSGVNTRFATWILIGTGAGEVETLTGNTGGPVGPDASHNINTIGDVASGIVVNGNPGTNTLTWTSSGGGHFGETLTGDTGGAVQFDSSGNINIITDLAANNGGASFGFVGTPSAHTLLLAVTDSNNNTTIGLGAGNTTSTGTNNTALGTDALTALTTGSFNTGMGSGTTLGMLTTGDQNTAIGYGVLDEITTGAGNTAIGAGAGNALTGADGGNVLINHPGIVGSANKWFMSFGSSGNLFSHNFGDRNTFIGEQAGNTSTTGATNTGVGFQALNAITTVNGSTAVGHLALALQTGGGGCEAFGTGALRQLTTGGSNVSIGGLSSEDMTTGGFNTAVGGSALNSVTTGNNNVGVGYLALASLTTGGFNTVIGQEAGDGLTTSDSSNIMINNTGTAGDNNTLRIGAGDGTGQGQLNMAFIHGIRGITTGINDAVAVLIDSAGQLGTVSSSIRYKENIKDMTYESDALFKLRPVTFNNKKDENKVKRFGLIAEEVGEVLPQLVVYDKEGNAETVKYHELPVFLLNELQKQKKTIDALSRTVLHLENLLQDRNCKY